MKTKIFAAAVLFLPLVLPSSLEADKQYTILTIAVRDAANDRPVHQAAVTVNFATSRKLRRDRHSEWNSKTNRRGLAEFPEIPSGEVRVQVIAPTYRTHGAVFQISGEEQTVTLKLEKPKKRQVSAHEPPKPKKKPTEEKDKRK